MENRTKLGRRAFGMAGLSAAALAALGRTAFAQVNQEKPAEHSGVHKMLQDCAKACSDCQRACDMCSTHCAMMLGEGKREHMMTLRTCLDCASVCATAAQIVARHGVYANLICQACAEVCKRCGDECAKFPDDNHMRECAEQCRACEKSCREMLEHAEAKAK